jgi:hypothetical protein
MLIEKASTEKAISAVDESLAVAIQVCVHYLCLIGRIYVLYVGHVDYETLFHVVILSKHHHHHSGKEEK